MRILHVLGKLDRGGVETWLVEVLRHIDRSKYQMDFLVHTTEPGAYDEDVRALGASIIPCLGPSNPLQYGWRFGRALRRHGPYDVVHSHVHHYSGYILALAAASGVSVRIAHSHNDTRAVEARRNWHRQVYLRFMEQLVSSFATARFAVSRDAALAFGEIGAKKAAWQQMRLGIDLTQFSAEIDKRAIRRSLNLPENGIVVGHVGRFVEQKNHSLLIDIAAEYLKVEPTATFLLVGDGPLRETIQERAAELGLAERFVFTGVRSDVCQLMRGAMDVFCFPSLHEGLGIVLLEAQAAGLPVVVSDSTPIEAVSIPELVVRRSLKEPASKWAQSIQQATTCSGLPSALAISKMDMWSIELSAAQLAMTYDLLVNAGVSASQPVLEELEVAR